MRQNNQGFKAYIENLKAPPSLDEIRRFMDAGVDVSFGGQQGNAYTVLIEKGYFDAARAIVNHPNYKTEVSLAYALSWAVIKDQYDLANLFLEIIKRDKPANTYPTNSFVECVVKPGDKMPCGFALHFAISKKKTKTVRLLLEAGANPQAIPAPEQKFLCETPPIALALSLVCQDPDPELKKILLMLLESPKYKPQLKDFGAQALSNPELLDAMILNLTLPSNNRAIGYGLMHKIVENPADFEKSSLLPYARAYVKIFGNLQERDIQAGLRELKSCKLKAAEILYDLRCDFANGIPENLDDLVSVWESPQSRFAYFSSWANLDNSNRADPEMCLKVARILAFSELGQALNLKSPSPYYQAAVEAKVEGAKAQYFNFVRNNAMREVVVKDFVEFAAKQSGPFRGECQRLVFTLPSLSPKIQAILDEKGLKELEPEEQRKLENEKFKAYIESLKGSEPDLAKIRKLMDDGADPSYGSKTDSALKTLLKLKHIEAAKAILYHPNYKPDKQLNFGILELLSQSQFVLVLEILSKFNVEPSRKIFDFKNYFYKSPDGIEKCALHYAISAGNKSLIKLMLDLGANPAALYGAKKPNDQGVLAWTPILYAFYIANQNPNLVRDEVICLLMRSPNFKFSRDYFGRFVVEWFKRNAILNPKSPSFEELLVRLTLIVEDREIGRTLMRCLPEKTSPELLQYSKAYLKIFGSTAGQEDVDIREGFKILEGCTLKAAKILRNLAENFDESSVSERARSIWDRWQEEERLAKEDPVQFYMKKSDFPSILMLAEAYWHGRLGLKADLNKANEYFKKLVGLNPEKGLLKYADFILSQQNNTELIDDFINFTREQKGDVRVKCEIIFLEFALDEGLAKRLEGLSVSEIVSAKDSKLEILKRIQILSDFLEDTSVHPELKAAVFPVNLEKDLKKQSEKDALDTVFEKFKAPEIVAALGRELERNANAQFYLLKLNTPLSRLILENYYYERLKNESLSNLKLILKSANCNECEKLAINKLLLNDMHTKSLELTTITVTRENVRRYCKTSGVMELPDVKAFYAKLVTRCIAGKYYFRREPTAEESSEARDYFYQAACQYLEAYRYLDRGNKADYLKRALQNLQDAAMLKSLPAIQKFNQLLQDPDWQSENALIQAFFEKCPKDSLPSAPFFVSDAQPSAPEKEELKEEDFDPMVAMNINGLILQAISAPREQAERKRELFEKAANIDPLCFSREILILVKGGDFAEKSQDMMLKVAENALNREAERASSSNGEKTRAQEIADCLREIMRFQGSKNASPVMAPQGFFPAQAPAYQSNRLSPDALLLDSESPPPYSSLPSTVAEPRSSYLQTPMAAAEPRSSYPHTPMTAAELPSAYLHNPLTAGIQPQPSYPQVPVAAAEPLPPSYSKFPRPGERIMDSSVHQGFFSSPPPKVEVQRSGSAEEAPYDSMVQPKKGLVTE